MHTYELAVVDGHKVGARAPVLSDKQVVIGDQFDCDIVLGGFAQGREHLAEDVQSADSQYSRAVLCHDSNTGMIRLNSIKGLIEVEGVVVDPGSAVDITPGQAVAICGSTFELIELVQDDLQASVAQEEGQSPSHATPIVAAKKPTANKHKGVGQKLAVAVVACLAIAAGLSYWIDGKYFAATTHDRATTLLQQLMARPEYSQIVLEQSGNGAIKVVGHVQKRSSLYQLRKSLNGMEQTVYVDVGVGEIMAESVASVFRVNNLEAVASSIASGEVLVKTTSNDLKLLSKVEAIAYADVAGLKKLEVQNTAPPITVTEEPAGNEFETLPGKRIVMVVSTEPTYILTEDGSRYFTGSILPSGHKVVAILEQKVELELDQNTIEVVF